MAFGKVIIGSVFDCKRGPIETWLKRYDAQLEIKWNPEKNDKKGVWEVWRRPNTKRANYEGELVPGVDLYTCEYVYNKHVHHVLDAEVLDWRICERIKEMDTFGKGDWLTKAENDAEYRKRTQEKSAREELTYAVKQHKKIFRTWAEEVSRGQNPGRVLNKFKPQ